ncbi:MAG: 8-amino-7-oxononanoate synthase [Cyclobacteriaceae bacterium]
MDSFLKEKLDERREKGLLRVLESGNSGIDFLSNDYLGLARNQELAGRIQDRVSAVDFLPNGGTGSRLLAGNHKHYEELEVYLSGLFQSEACLTFNAGYAANQAIVSSVAEKGDTILYDQLSHVCLKEGAWLSKAESFSFAHNDVADLEQKLKRAKGRVFVITESVFSMDGDEAPLREIIDLCNVRGAYLIVDEAHSTGSFGKSGAGWLVEKNLYQEVFARVYTFGKGMGVHGACVAGSQKLMEYLINFGRSFIYTTSLPPHSVISIHESFKFLAEHSELQLELAQKIQMFKSYIATDSDTSIQPIQIPGNKEVRRVAKELQEKGFNVRPIVSPTVKEGTERLRICLHTFNTDEEITGLASELKNYIG